MRILKGGSGATATYDEVRGPTGDRYLKWRWGLADRMKARFGVGESKDDQRRLRNARKVERREARR